MAKLHVCKYKLKAGFHPHDVFSLSFVHVMTDSSTCSNFCPEIYCLISITTEIINYPILLIKILSVTYLHRTTGSSTHLCHTTGSIIHLRHHMTGTTTYLRHHTTGSSEHIVQSYVVTFASSRYMQSHIYYHGDKNYRT